MTLISPQMSTGSVIHLRKPIQARFEPLPDITAYELAIILNKVHGIPLYDEDWKALGSSITRHFARLS